MDLHEQAIGLKEFKLKAKHTKNFGALKSQLQRLWWFANKKKKEFSDTCTPFKIICFGFEHYYFFDREADGWRRFIRKITKNRKPSPHLSWIVGAQGY